MTMTVEQALSVLDHARWLSDDISNSVEREAISILRSHIEREVVVTDEMVNRAIFAFNHQPKGLAESMQTKARRCLISAMEVGK